VKLLEAGGENASKRAISALLFMQAGMYALDAMSALNSSPWTSENFGADPVKAASCREYVLHSVAVSTAYCVASAVIAENPMPLIGATVNNLYLYWLYNRALKRGATSGSKSWAK
jgi:hypothetical protein